eukprot:scaffold1878_cov170-Amphora_coffeaeformis.AAC.9
MSIVSHAEFTNKIILVEPKKINKKKANHLPTATAALAAIEAAADYTSHSRHSSHCTIRTIQPWHVVLGDTNARHHRTTTATLLFRQVKKEFRQTFYGQRATVWVPLAIGEFYHRLQQETFDDPPRDEQADDPLGTVLLKINSKTQDRLYAPHSTRVKYKYDGDEEALFGLAKPQEALQHHLLSRDSPTLEGELARHAKQFQHLQTSRRQPPADTMDTFDTTLRFYQSQLAKAERGEKAATQLLASCPSPINTLNNLWKLLLRERGPVEEDEDYDDSSSFDPDRASPPREEKGTKGLKGDKDDDTKQNTKPSAPQEHERNPAESLYEHYRTDFPPTHKHDLKEQMPKEDAFIVEHLRLLERGGIRLEDSEPFMPGTGKENINQAGDPLFLDATREGFHHDDMEVDVITPSSQARIRPRENDDEDDRGGNVRVKRLCPLGILFFPVLMTGAIVGGYSIPNGQDDDATSSTLKGGGVRSFNETRLYMLVDKLEHDVMEFGQQLEMFHTGRCREESLQQGIRGNYDECRSNYPNEECLGGESFHLASCQDQDSDFCSGLYDFSVSTVRLPGEILDGNLTEDRVLETISYTQQMDEWLQSKRAAEKDFWQEMGVEPRAWHFGSATGAFRIWPGRQSRECGMYDPRTRPWYVAASSGPKNVVMVLDTSRSMAGLRIRLLKEAAKRVVDTLTAGDHIAIVPFGTDADSAITDENGKMIVATEENKKVLIDTIEALEAGGLTNYYAAFNTAFDIFDRSVYTAAHCNTAILFMTDGEMKEMDLFSPDEDMIEDRETEDEVLRLVNERLTYSNSLVSNPILLFSYSVSQADKDHDLPSKLACSAEWGIWSHVTSDTNIMDGLSSYYRVFALGLGNGPNKDFVTWVNPYEYDPGESLGTSVSIPVYDRSKTPPLFLGVATIDISVAAFDAAVGTRPEQDSESLIRLLALNSKAKCPILNLDRCQIESFRRNKGESAMCMTNCTMDEIARFELDDCLSMGEDPPNLWENTDNAGVPFDVRGMCGNFTPEQEATSPRVAALIGVSLSGLLFLLCFIILIWRSTRTTRRKPEEKSPATALSGPDEENAMTLVVNKPIDGRGRNVTTKSEIRRESIRSNISHRS